MRTEVHGAPLGMRWGVEQLSQGRRQHSDQSHHQTSLLRFRRIACIKWVGLRIGGHSNTHNARPKFSRTASQLLVSLGISKEIESAGEFDSLRLRQESVGLGCRDGVPNILDKLNAFCDRGASNFVRGRRHEILILVDARRLTTRASLNVPAHLASRRSSAAKGRSAASACCAAHATSPPVPSIFGPDCTNRNPRYRACNPGEARSS